VDQQFRLISKWIAEHPEVPKVDNYTQVPLDAIRGVRGMFIMKGLCFFEYEKMIGFFSFKLKQFF
jgi:hypothetical protein